jgi:GTPase SAR1 family protein
MTIVILKEKTTKEDLKNAREEYPNYIKITADLSQEVVLIGGEYHADAEKVLIEKYGSKQKDIWGGGYNITLKKFEVNAIINMRQPLNDSTDILDPEIRNNFLRLVEKKLSDVQSLI